MAIAGMENGYGMKNLSMPEVTFTDREPGSNRQYIDGKSYADKIASQEHAPYDDMADASGIITYHGVTFVCDSERNQITLGDVSNSDEVLTIPLEKGGALIVNRENIGELSRAITMFSPEDVRRIMTAIAQDTQCARKCNEIEEMENEVGRNLGEE